MSDFLTRVALASLRFFGISYGAFMLVLSPFAFNGGLASEAEIAPSIASNFIEGLTMAWVGSTLLVPLRLVSTKPVLTWLLFASYFVSVGLLVVQGVSIGEGGLGVTLWQVVFVALNVAALVYVTRSESPDGA